MGVLVIVNERLRLLALSSICTIYVFSPYLRQVRLLNEDF